MSTSTTADTLAGLAPRVPASTALTLVSSIIRRASSRSNGGTRMATSSNTSTITPPRPNATAGPNSSSRLTPTIVSTPLGAVSQTSTPSTCAPFASRAMVRMKSSQHSRTAAGPSTPRRTSPRSDLWAMSGESIFMTTGAPIPR